MPQVVVRTIALAHCHLFFIKAIGDRFFASGTKQLVSDPIVVSTISTLETFPT
jgi:hypothetical protein